MYTVKQLAELAQVSVRTLHHYDQIGLLRPTRVGANGYRHYDDAALLRLQQILLYREMGLELLQIRAVLDSSDFDLTAALHAHHRALEHKITRLQELVRTVERTIRHIEGEEVMSKRQIFKAISPDEEQELTREARLQYGPDLVNQSVQRWGSYTQARKDAILEEGNQLYTEISAALEAGKAADSPEVQSLIERWHNHLRYFYEPPMEVLRGLGGLYNDDPRFRANFDQFHPELAGYMRGAINQYVDDLETAEIMRLIAEDDERRDEG